MSSQSIRAGMALSNITPSTSQFLCGYPHVKRMSAGVHDPLYAQALYIANGDRQVLFISADLNCVPKISVIKVRKRIAEKTGIPAEHILVSASHTHSGPVVNSALIIRTDSFVPNADGKYVKLFEDGIVDAGVAAHCEAAPATLGLTRADATGIGTNRHDPTGPSSLTTPVLVVKDADGDKLRAVMIVCAMHPTVMHEDSMLVSADFPGMTRQYLKKHLGDDVVFVYHMGTAGDQSPRHVTQSNTFDEATRIGNILGKAIVQSLSNVHVINEAIIDVNSVYLDLPLRQFPSVDEAMAACRKAADQLRHLRANGASTTEMRTAECDWFGAENTVTLAKASNAGDLDKRKAELMPAEVMLIRIGDWKFIGWPGEVFVEFGLQITDADPNAFVITLAGGDLQGYLVTQENIDKKSYEANNAIFKNPHSPEMIVKTTKQLLVAQTR